MHIDEYEPIRGGGYIPLPKWIRDKTVFNTTQKQGNRCFSTTQ